MITIITSLIVLLIIIVVVVNAIQQRRLKLEQENRAKMAKQKAILDETEELIINNGNLPYNPILISILNKRSMNAAKAMIPINPRSKEIRKRAKEMEDRFKSSQDLANNQPESEETFTLPDDEQQLISILQCIKKLRALLRSEQAKGVLSAQLFVKQDLRLNGMQLKISVESLAKRANIAFSKEMLGSARQYYEKALQTLNDFNQPSDYKITKTVQISEQLAEITNALKNTNAKDAAQKEKDSKDDLDVLFQPKQKW